MGGPFCRLASNAKLGKAVPDKSSYLPRVVAFECELIQNEQKHEAENNNHQAHGRLHRKKATVNERTNLCRVQRVRA